jgi:hypothetical protein
MYLFKVQIETAAGTQASVAINADSYREAEAFVSSLPSMRGNKILWITWVS